MTDYAPGPYGPGPEFGDGEIEFDHRGGWQMGIRDAKTALFDAKSLLNCLKDEWEADIHQKTGAQELKTDELETIEGVIESLEEAIKQMEAI